MGAAGVLLAGRDMAVSVKGDVEGSMRLGHLFTYQYERPWPGNVDFSAPLWAFTVLGAVLLFAWLVPRAQRHAAAALCILSCIWTAWGLNVYLVGMTPHWAQRNTMSAYYQNRSGPEAPLVAFQMTWKGENFYTGNRMATFVTTGDKFKSWVEEQREKGVKVMFFTTEHSRKNTLRRELSQPEHFEELTTKADNNKFFLARVKFED
jgi:hypothetical protein